MHVPPDIKTKGNFKKIQARFIDVPLHGGFNFNGDIYVKYGRFSAYNATTEHFVDFPPMRKVLLLRGTQAEMHFISNVLEQLRFSF